MHATQEQPSEDPNGYANLLKEYIWDAMDARIDQRVEEQIAELMPRLAAKAATSLAEVFAP